MTGTETAYPAMIAWTVTQTAYQAIFALTVTKTAYQAVFVLTVTEKKEKKSVLDHICLDFQTV